MPEGGVLVLERVVLYSLLPLGIVVIFLFFVFYRQKRESDVRLSVAELRLDALRAQMNPHFIFNSLNSIYLYIEANEKTKAGEYLLAFSSLIRKVLTFSRSELITLQEDREAITLYIGLERMKKEFEVCFQIDEGIDEELVLIPPLIAQPLVENAIVHGFSDTQKGGRINIAIRRNDQYLEYVVSDNGRPSIAKSHHPGEPSVGLDIIQERLTLFSAKSGLHCRIQSEELRSESNDYIGRSVTLYLPWETEV